MWPAEGCETIGHFDVKCSEVHPFDGYDIIKLDATKLAGVSGNQRPHVHEEVYVIAVHVMNCIQNMSNSHPFMNIPLRATLLIWSLLCFITTSGPWMASQR